MPVVLGAMLAVSFARTVRQATKKSRRAGQGMPPPCAVVGAEATPGDAGSLSGRWSAVHARAKWKVGKWTAFAGKKQLAALDMRLSKLLTGSLRSTQVLGGKGEWLFYKSPEDGDSIADYVGESRFDRRLLDDTLDALGELDQKLRRQGVPFCLLVAPNKENVYPEYMPDKIVRVSSESRTDVMMQYLLDRADFPVAYPKKALMDGKRHAQLYYTMDTHWNILGGYIGVQSVMEAIGQKPVPLEAREIVRNGPPHKNDLVRMAKASSMYTATFSPDWSIMGLPPAKRTGKDFWDYSHNENPAATSEKSILIVGDSFKTSTRSSFLERFRHVHDVHMDRCDDLQKLIAKTKPDLVLLEFVERHAGLIAATARRLAKGLD